MPSRVVLIGPSGSGKSALAIELAKRLGFAPIDIDERIEAQIGMDISNFFARFGEGAFRALEREAIALACQQDQVVIATGGGAVLDRQNWTEFRPRSVIIGLTAQPELLVKRVTCQNERDGNRTLRPMLEGNPIQRIREQLALRGPLYQQADVQIQTDGKTIEGVVEEAAACIKASHASGLAPALSLSTPIARSDIYIGSGARRTLPGLIQRRWPTVKRLWIISDQHVADLWSNELLKLLQVNDILCELLVVQPGEESKSFTQLERIIQEMTAKGVTRRDLVVAFGGGVVGDLAGFVAATCLRGLALLQVPTSLLAMVDSSVGGKTAINTRAGKNLVGAFYQPAVVMIDPDYLGTLPRVEYRSGMAEVIKHSFIQPSTPLGGESLLDLLADAQTLDPVPHGSIEQLLEVNVAIKHSVVQADERENQLRMILNYGHTLGHAIEADGYRYRHGEAVSLGMIAAARIACHLDVVGGWYLEQVIERLDRAGLPTEFEGAPESVVARLGHDKKNIDGRLHWILPRASGGVEIHDDVPLDIARNALIDMTIA